MSNNSRGRTSVSCNIVQQIQHSTQFQTNNISRHDGNLSTVPLKKVLHYKKIPPYAQNFTMTKIENYYQPQIHPSQRKNNKESKQTIRIINRQNNFLPQQNSQISVHSNQKSIIRQVPQSAISRSPHFNIDLQHCRGASRTFYGQLPTTPSTASRNLINSSFLLQSALVQNQQKLPLYIQSPAKTPELCPYTFENYYNQNIKSTFIQRSPYLNQTTTPSTGNRNFVNNSGSLLFQSALVNNQQNLIYNESPAKTPRLSLNQCENQYKWNSKSPFNYGLLDQSTWQINGRYTQNQNMNLPQKENDNQEVVFKSNYQDLQRKRKQEQQEIENKNQKQFQEQEQLKYQEWQKEKAEREEQIKKQKKQQDYNLWLKQRQLGEMQEKQKRIEEQQQQLRQRLIQQQLKEIQEQKQREVEEQQRQAQIEAELRLKQQQAEEEENIRKQVEQQQEAEKLRLEEEENAMRQQQSEEKKNQDLVDSDRDEEEEKDLQSINNQQIQFKELNLQYASGYIYSGLGRLPDIREGFGIFYDPQGTEVYRGEWLDNEFHGQGKYMNLQQEQKSNNAFNWRDMTQIGNKWIGYQGSYLNGVMHGIGSIYFTNGEVYKGEFMEGLPHGNGEYTTTFKTKIKGIWEYGKYIQPNK